MLRLTYFWMIIIPAMGIFLIGVYKNIVSKIAYILWVNNFGRGDKTFRDTRVKLPVPAVRTMIDEVILQKRVINRSSFLWIRHLLIFFGFLTVFVFDQTYFFSKIFHYDYLVHGAGRGFLIKLGLESGGGVLFIGLTSALIHRILFAEAEKKYVNLQLVLLLWGVVFTGFLAEAFRFVIEPNDQFISYSFIAGPLSRVLANIDCPWEFLADSLWIIHASLVAWFFAYIPYSKFIHIFTVPIGRSLTQGVDVAKMKMHKISEGLL